jgi:hypothetical protein
MVIRRAVLGTAERWQTALCTRSQRRARRARETIWQVPLTDDDGACEGGLLLFACEDGRLMHV